jgi:hypothetical protein
MSFLDQLREYVRACFPGLWIVSCEPEGSPPPASYLGS